MPQIDLFDEIKFESYPVSIPRLLDAVNAGPIFKNQTCIMLKPNLVNDSAFPVTTRVDCCRAVVGYIKKVSTARIIIAEGCGDAVLDTPEIFDRLGYSDLAGEWGVELIDLNTEDLIELADPQNTIFPTMFLPKIAFECFLFSLPVLKAHSLAGMTGTLKNMMGLAPPAHYSGGGFWKKAQFHQRMQQSIIELNRYRRPDFTLLDASIGLRDYHLGGPICDPPVNKLAVSTNPFTIDQYAARLLGLDPMSIAHIHPPSS